MKKIEIDSCEHCPLRKYEQFLGDGWKDVCLHEYAEGMIIKDKSIIHLDCKLKEN